MSNVTLDDMKSKLLTVDDVREKFATTEGLTQAEVKMFGAESELARFELGDNWNHEIDRLRDGLADVDATVAVNGKEYVLTKDALLEATSMIGLQKQYVCKTPASLIQPHLNYWYSSTEKELKVLVNSDDRVLAFMKGTIDPFSNLQLLDKSLEAVEAAYGKGEIWIDYKLQHSLRRTSMRIIIPSYERSPRVDDPWCAGVQMKNSLVGEKPLSFNGYLFRWWCTNGAIDVHNASGNWNRRRRGQGDEAYEWARQSVEDILGGMESKFAEVEQLANTPIPFLKEDGSPDPAAALQDVFETYHMPVEPREQIIQVLEHTNDGTMYGIMQAVTQVANDPAMVDTTRESLMVVGSDIAHARRCGECRSLIASLN